MAVPPQDWRRPFPLALLGAAVAVVALVLLPEVYLALRGIGGGQAWSVLTAPATGTLVLRSLGLATTVTLTACCLAVPLALLLRSDAPGRGALRLLLVLPLAIPSYVGALAIKASIGAGGLSQQWLGHGVWLRTDGFIGAWLVLSLLSFPYVLLTVDAALGQLDARLVESARVLGRSLSGAIRAVVLPLVWPAVLSGGLLVFLYTLGDFGAVSLMRYDTFTRVLYTQYQTTLDRSGTAALALVLVALTLGVLVLDTWLRRRLAKPTALAHGAPRLRLELGRAQAPLLVLGWSVVSLSLVLPAAALLTWAGRAEALHFPWQAMGNAVWVATLAAVVVALAAVPVAAVVGRVPSRLAGMLGGASYVGFAVPGVVVGLALVFFAARQTPWLYQTVPLLVLAYLVRFLPQSVGATREALALAPRRLEEAARTLGRTEAGAFTSVTLPVAKAGIIAGAMLVFITTLKELPATMVLAPPNFDTLATEVWHATEEAFFAEAALPALVLMATASLPTLLRLGGRRRRHA